MDFLTILKEYSPYGSPIITAIITPLLTFFKGRLLRMEKANGIYANILMNHIVDGQKPSVHELNRLKQMVAFQYEVHISRMAGVADGIIRAVNNYIANPVYTASQRKQFLYNLKAYGQHYRDIQVPDKFGKEEYLTDWWITTGVVYLVWVLDYFLFGRVELGGTDFVILAGLAVVYSAISTMIVNFMIYFCWERRKKKSEKRSWEMIHELCRRAGLK